MRATCTPRRYERRASTIQFVHLCKQHCHSNSTVMAHASASVVRVAAQRASVRRPLACAAIYRAGSAARFLVTHVVRVAMSGSGGVVSVSCDRTRIVRVQRHGQCLPLVAQRNDELNDETSLPFARSFVVSLGVCIWFARCVSSRFFALCESHR